MKLYGAIDLHSNNSYIVLLNELGRLVFRKRLPNDLPLILSCLDPFRSEIEGITVESTYNWYWLVDGLMEAGFKVHLANTAAMQQYEGLKFADDAHDARWLADQLRLGILPEGFIYPKAERAVRDLLRKRSRMVQHRVAQVLSIQNSVSRYTGKSLSEHGVSKLTLDVMDKVFVDPEVSMAVKSNLSVMNCLDEQISQLEKVVLKKMRSHPSLQSLMTVDGIGIILGLTILLETGDIKRFSEVGQFASYCRCVGSQWMSNGKKKGTGNRKNGNKYLSWAFVEAARFAIRYNEQIRRYYQKKTAKKNKIVAIKTVAHKLARACYYIMRDQVPFDVQRAFA